MRLVISIWVCAASMLWSGPGKVHAQCSTPTTTSGGIALTFDDTHLEEWHGILPLLDEFGVSATFFITRYHSLNSTQRGLVQEILAAGHEVASHGRDHANATTYCPGNTTGCTLTADQRAASYVAEQILPDIENMAADGIYPRSFAYPFGADLSATTTQLLGLHDYVRDTSYYPNHQRSFVTCEGSRFIAGLGIDTAYDIEDAEHDLAMDQAMCEDSTLVWYGHAILAGGYHVGEDRLRSLLSRAVSRGLTFRRLRDVCTWQSTQGAMAAFGNVYDSPRPLGEVRFADIDGDGDDDAFRTTSGKWQWLENLGGTFENASGTAHWIHRNTSVYEIGVLTLANFDGHGGADVFRIGANAVAFVSWNGVEAWQEVAASGYPLDQLRFADFDGDGRTDVFRTTNGTWKVSYGATGRWLTINSSSYALDRLRFGDFDGDGGADVFVSSNGRWYVSDNGTGKWEQLNASSYPVTQLAFADVVGDQRTDVLRQTDGIWHVSDGGTGKWDSLGPAPGTLATMTFVDLDGDGDDEIMRMGPRN